MSLGCFSITNLFSSSEAPDSFFLELISVPGAMSVGLERQLAVKSKNHSTKEMESQMFRVRRSSNLNIVRKKQMGLMLETRFIFE